VIEPSLPLSGWAVISLRDARQNTALRRAVRRAGGTLLAVPGFRLRAIDDARARADLAAALAAPVCLFVSPAAVRYAARLQPLADYPGMALAPGPGTASALRRAGVTRVDWPRRELRSEGILALPALNPPPACVGQVAAPGGRELFGRVLGERGVRLFRAEVYRREPCVLTARQRQTVQALRGPYALLLSSLEAFEQVLGQLADDIARLRAAVVVAASARLADAAAAHGFGRIVTAPSARPAALITTLITHAKPMGFR